MLSVNECRKYLDEKTSQSLSDKEVLALRDQMVAWADLAFEALCKEKKWSFISDDLQDLWHE